jgi:uncharacterized protein YecE (DUF72 family)
MSRVPYFLGCPVWACRRWDGHLYTRSAGRDQWLRQYSSVFNTVEGNSTFYALPPRDTIQRWIETSQPGFRFVLKFPKAISHEKRLLHAQAETDAFLEVLEQLRDADRLGPAFLQLPHGFSGHHLDDLERYVRGLPTGFHFAVELRNLDFFGDGLVETHLNQMLAELHMDRVVFDSRCLFSAPPDDESEQASQGRKPRLPIHTMLTGRYPLLRFVGRNDLRRAIPWIQEWVPVVARWIEHGVQPFVFTHTPDEFYAPSLARLFHEQLMAHRPELLPRPAWPGEQQAPTARQLELF